MSRTATFRVLAGIDGLQIRRDPLLRWIPAIPLALALAMRLGVPAAVERLQSVVDIPFERWYAPVLGVALVLVVPLLVGMIVGFLLLEQREDRTLAALRVTPVSLRMYIAYRLTVPVLVSVLATLVALPLAGFDSLTAPHLLLATAVAAPLAGLYALALPAFAANRVQGFAFIKAVGGFGMVPLVALFVSGPIEVLFALVPTWWMARLYWSLTGVLPGPAWFFALGGAVYCSLLLMLLARRLERRLGSM
jgi:fluoroquinolone transport system permease protein